MAAYEEATAIAWMLFAIICCLILATAFGAVAALLWDKIDWVG